MASAEPPAVDTHKGRLSLHLPDELTTTDKYKEEVERDDDDGSEEDGDEDGSEDGDTASQRSISLSSPSHTRPSSTHLIPTSLNTSASTPNPDPNTSPTKDSDDAEQGHGHGQEHDAEHDIDTSAEQDHAITPITLIRQGLSLTNTNTNRDSHAYTVDTDFSSEHDVDDRSLFMRRLEGSESPVSSVSLSLDDGDGVGGRKNEKVEVEKEDEEGAHEKVESILTAAQSFEGTNTVPLPSTTAVKSPSPPVTPPTASYPPPPLQKPDSRGSIASFASSSTSYSKKARPESVLVNHAGPIVLGIALVDFNHLVGPKIEFSKGSIFEDDEISKILPFLALPDGAHLTVEDYSYFHLVPPSTKPTTVFGISCNRQIRTSDLLVKEQDMTRSTVQKAVVVLASKPVFGPIRDRLGVVTKALFAQRDFTDMTILEDFHTSLELGLRSQLTESGLYMGTSLRELVHMFRQRTLILLKALMLQKKIMFYGHPVEKLCTYQYSLITLVPNLLQNLDDCGSPPLATRAQALERPTELKTSDPRSMMRFVGLPLDLFGKDSFFQPYLPLQQLDMLKGTSGWLCGTTNSIVTQQKEVDLLVNVESAALEFRNPTLERSAGLTPADRKWMDDVVKDVNDHWEEGEVGVGAGGGGGGAGIQFKGSDDYLRQKFEEYISGALASVKYSNFLAKGQGSGSGVVIADGAGNPNAIQDFNMLWISEFKKTNAYEVWDRVTDPLLFDIVEPRHPCTDKPTVVSDIGIRLAEGLNDLKLDAQLDAIQRTFNAGSTGFFRAVEGVRGRWMQRSSVSVESGGGSGSGSVSVSVSGSGGANTTNTMTGNSSTSTTRSRPPSTSTPPSITSSPQPPPAHPRGMRPLSLVGGRSPLISGSGSGGGVGGGVQPEVPPVPAVPVVPVQEIKPSLSSWGSGLTSFFSSRGRGSGQSQPQTPTRASTSTSTSNPTSTSTSTSNTTANSNTNPNSNRTSNPTTTPPPPLRTNSPTLSLASTRGGVGEVDDDGMEELKPRNLDEVYSVRGSIGVELVAGGGGDKGGGGGADSKLGGGLSVASNPGPTVASNVASNSNPTINPKRTSQQDSLNLSIAEEKEEEEGGSGFAM